MDLSQAISAIRSMAHPRRKALHKGKRATVLYLPPEADPEDQAELIEMTKRILAKDGVDFSQMRVEQA